MKTLKLLGAVTLCSALFAGAAFAQEGAVYSLNVVGFQKVGTPAGGRTISATPFDIENNDVNDAIGTQLTGGTGVGDADLITFYDVGSQSYVSLYLRDASGPPVIHNKWIDVNTSQIATNRLYIGESWWIKNQTASDETVVLVGDVVMDEAVTNSIVSGLQLVSYPFSAPIAVQDLAFISSGAQQGTGVGDADQITFFDADSQSYISLYLRDASGPPVIHNKWIDVNTSQIATNILQPGVGIWYRHLGSGFDWVEARPYTM